MRWRKLLVLLAMLPLSGLVACGDDPFQIDWQLAPAEVLLYSLARPELNLPTAFQMNRRRTVQIESPGATGTWDFAVDTQDGQIVLLTPSALGLDSRAAIAPMPGMNFDSIREAPADTASYIRSEPVVIQPDLLYVVQTGESVGSFGRLCVYYGKIEALDIDPAQGVLRLRYDSNPVCNDRALVPPED